MYYLDNAATTRVLESAAKEAYECMVNSYGNPSSLHLIGSTALDKLDKSRYAIAKILRCKPQEIYFTSCATESNNTAIFGAASARKRRGNKIITSKIEHPSVNSTVNELEKRGYEVVKVSPRNGVYHAEDFINEVDDNTILLTVMYVNNETGLILPIPQIIDGVKRKNKDVLIHIDGVQAFCKFDISLKELNCDLFSVSSHKIHGPKGVGALYIREGIKIDMLLYGGGQERGFRSGTEAIPLISGFKVAAEQMYKIKDDAYLHVKKINKNLRKEFKNIKEISINSNENSSPYIINFSINGIPAEIMLHFLEDKGIYLSSGSACSKGNKSGILPILGYIGDKEETSLRASFSFDTPPEAVDSLSYALKEGIKNIVR